MLINIQDKLYKNILQFLEINKNIDNIEKEINRWLEVGFNIERFGETPFTFNTSIQEKATQTPIAEIERIDTATIEKEQIEKEINIEVKPQKRKLNIIRHD